MEFDVDRPAGRLDPPSSDLTDIRDAVDERHFQEALNAVEEYGPPSSYHADWAHYLKGRAFFGLEYFEAGYNAFEQPYVRTSDVLTEEQSAQRFRLAAMALKKMGWLQRRNEEFERAYALHAIEFRYLRQYGSFQEMHDATISLDVDSYFLKNPNLSRMWLESGVEVAEHIEQPATRYKALGMSWNNLAGTYCELQRFEDADEAIHSSLEQWTEYEELTGADEYRRVWAHYGIGDVYQRWGDFLAEMEDEEAAREKFDEAKHALTGAVQLAEKQSMPTGDRQPLKSKLHRIESQLREHTAD